jgi:MFS family permease
MADMVGRKRVYGVEVLVLAAGAIACASVPNIWWLSVFTVNSVFRALRGLQMLVR